MLICWEASSCAPGGRALGFSPKLENEPLTVILNTSFYKTKTGREKSEKTGEFLLPRTQFEPATFIKTHSGGNTPG